MQRASHTAWLLQQVDDESFHKFMDRFDQIVFLIRNLNLEVALHSMLLALWPGKFVDNLCKKPPNSMDELCERVKGYMEEMSRFKNEVGQKHDKREGDTRTDLHKLEKWHKQDKC